MQNVWCEVETETLKIFRLTLVFKVLNGESLYRHEYYVTTKKEIRALDIHEYDLTF
jgi:hypothetical protein